MEVTWHEGILGNVGVLGKDREKEKSHHPCDETNHTGKSKVLIKFKSLNNNNNKLFAITTFTKTRMFVYIYED